MINPSIRGYHAQVYFSKATLTQAKALSEAAAQQFELVLGRVHEKAVDAEFCQILSSVSKSPRGMVERIKVPIN